MQSRRRFASSIFCVDSLTLVERSGFSRHAIPVLCIASWTERIWSSFIAWAARKAIPISTEPYSRAVCTGRADSGQFRFVWPK